MTGRFRARLLTLLVCGLIGIAPARAIQVEAQYPAERHDKRVAARLRKIDSAAQVRWDPERHDLFLRGEFTQPDYDGDPVELATRFLAELALPFPPEQAEGALTAEKPTVDGFGVTHVTFRQSFRGVPVWGKRLKVHLDPENRVVGVSGQYVPLDLDLDIEPRISAQQAIDAAREHGGESVIGPPEVSPELVVFERRGAHHLTWTMVLPGETEGGGEARWNYFVDAVTGSVVFRFDRVNSQSVATTGSGLDCRGEELTLQVVDEDGDRFTLRDVSRRSTGGGDVITRDGSDTSEDADGVWDNTDTSPRSKSQQPETAVHFWVGRSYDLLKSLSGRESYDDAGHDVVSAVHAGRVNNATWNGKKLQFGDGDGVKFGYLGCANDVVAHELMHAVTEHTAGLEYLDESGALNEAYSDIFGAMVDDEDWIIGEDARLEGTFEGLRDMADPTRGGAYDPADDLGTLIEKGVPQPGRYQDIYVTDVDNGGVHFNSGIFNRAFYLIAEGDVPTLTGSGHTCHPGVGRESAWDIFYAVLTGYLSPSATFFEAGDALGLVAPMAIGADPFALLVVEDSLGRTGIGGTPGLLTCVEASTWLTF